MAWYNAADVFDSGGEFKADGRNAAQPYTEDVERNKSIILDPGSTYSRSLSDENRIQNENGYQGFDTRNYMYGRDPYAAQNQINANNQLSNFGLQAGTQAVNSGNAVAQGGQSLLNERTGDSTYFNNRQTAAPYANAL